MARPKKKERASKGQGCMRFDDRRNQNVYTIYYTDELGQRKRKHFYGQSEAECIEKAEKFKRMLLIGLDKCSLTICDLLKYQADIDLKTNEVKPSAYQRRLDSIRIIEKHPISKMAIIDIDKPAIDAFYSDLLDYSQSVIKKVTYAVNSAFTIAISQDIVTVNPIKKYKIKCPKSNKETKVVTALKIEEENKLLNALQSYKPKTNSQDYRTQIYIELFTGMRMGEINALTKKDIDLVNRTIDVNKTVSRKQDYSIYISPTPKTEASKRVIPMNANAYEIFKDLLQRSENVDEDDLLFYDYEKQKPISTSQVNDCLKRIEKKYGLPTYSTHSLRHTFATRCIEAGVQAVVIKNWLGHNDVKITLNTYTNVFEQLEDASVKKVDGFNNGLTFNLKSA